LCGSGHEVPQNVSSRGLFLVCAAAVIALVPGQTALSITQSPVSAQTSQSEISDSLDISKLQVAAQAGDASAQLQLGRAYEAG
jgi:uncharacterized membrane protein YjjB (DUF3815 family)